MAVAEIRYRMPREEDAAEIWTLIQNTEGMDLNSAYCYLLLCTFFRKTCVVAEMEGKIVGFVSAFHPPEQKDTVFVWQIVVENAVRGKNVGGNMLRHLLQRDSCSAVRYLEATVSPTNIPSHNLFKGLASHLGTACAVSEHFPPERFPTPHETEWLYRIGPIDTDLRV